MDCFIFAIQLGKEGLDSKQTSVQYRILQTVMFFDMNIIYVLGKYH